jgi:hypothetical protein
MATIVYRVSELYARAVLCFGAKLGSRNLGATDDVIRPSAAQRAISDTGARPMSAYLILGALVRFLRFERFSAIIASDASTPARSKSSS